MLLALLFPLLARWAERRNLLPHWCSPIVACYAVGIAVANLRLYDIDRETLETLAGVSMLLGMPLLLFTVRVGPSLRTAPRLLLSFGLCCVAGLTATLLAAWLFATTLPDIDILAGMLVGLYTGGTPNVQAIGVALGAPADYLVLIQAADTLLGGTYLLALVTILPPVYARFYPPTQNIQGADAGAVPTESPKQTPGNYLYQVATTILVIGLSAVGSRLLTGRWLDFTIIILVLTTLSLLVVSSGKLRKGIGNSYPFGEYFVLVFCVALGLLADFRALAAAGLPLLAFSAVALTMTTGMHLLLARWWRIDRDTVMLSYVAALYGPVFVVQMAAALGNRRLLAGGIAVALLGFGLGNYLGIGMSIVVDYLLGFMG